MIHVLLVLLVLLSDVLTDFPTMLQISTRLVYCFLHVRVYQ